MSDTALGSHTYCLLTIRRSSHYIGYIPTELYDRSGSGLDSSVDDGHVGFAPKPLAMASQIALAGRFTIEQVDAPL